MGYNIIKLFGTKVSGNLLKNFTRSVDNTI